jgi:hypothetical protein
MFQIESHFYAHTGLDANPIHTSHIAEKTGGHHHTQPFIG